MKLDDFITTNWKNTAYHKKIDRLGPLFYVLTVASVVNIFIRNNVCFFTVLVIVLVASPVMAYWVVRSMILERHLRKSIECNYVPLSLRRAATEIYGSGGHGFDAYEAARECYECHVPGDCPLCGAN